MKNFFTSLLSDNSGGFSTYRVTMLFWFLLISSMMVIATIKAPGTIPEVPANTLALTLAILGGKVIQRIGEKAEDDESSS